MDFITGKIEHVHAHITFAKAAHIAVSITLFSPNRSSGTVTFVIGRDDKIPVIGGNKSELLRNTGGSGHTIIPRPRGPRIDDVRCQPGSASCSSCGGRSGSDPCPEQSRLCKIVRKPDAERSYDHEQDVECDHFHWVMFEEFAIFHGHLRSPFTKHKSIEKKCLQICKLDIMTHENTDRYSAPVAEKLQERNRASQDLPFGSQSSEGTFL